MRSAGDTTTARGKFGEDLAEAFLVQSGYQIIARNHRCEGGELDLIAWDSDVLCFIEVRSRASVQYGHPLETIDNRKIRRIVRAAGDYAAQLQGPWPPMRFDALGIVLTDPPEFTLVRAAFEVA